MASGTIHTARSGRDGITRLCGVTARWVRGEAPRAVPGGAVLSGRALGGRPGDRFPVSPVMPRFINARRRILQPMLDSSCSETPKTKKKTAQNRPVQRFWPDSIASGAAQPPPSELAMSEGGLQQVLGGGVAWGEVWGAGGSLAWRGRELRGVCMAAMFCL